MECDCVVTGRSFQGGIIGIMPCLLGQPESSPCAGISAPANCLNLIYARKPFNAVRIEGANEQHEVVDDDGGGGPPCPAPPPGSKLRLLPCPLPLPVVDPRFEGWLASRCIPLVNSTAPAGILVVFVDPTRHSRLDVSLRISCVIQNELCRTASSLDICSRSTGANEAKSGKRWPIGKLFSLNNAKITKRIVAIVQRAECNLAILRARSA
jgi:hypothetical protein